MNNSMGEIVNKMLLCNVVLIDDLSGIGSLNTLTEHYTISDEKAETAQKKKKNCCKEP